MAVHDEIPNPLILTGTVSEASPTVQLHPLVLLTISDYITRHTLRSQTGPIVGAIIGQTLGRTYTLEFAYECKTSISDDAPGGDVLVDAEWFLERLESYREVHKQPALDLVALFVLGPVEGPQPAHLSVVRQVQKLTGMDGVLLLMFHSSVVEHLQGGKLPISLYEPVVVENESEQQPQESQSQTHSPIKFRELAFEVDSGDAEMIGVDFVAKGGGNAAAVTKASGAGGDAGKDKKAKNKGKSKEKDGEGDGSGEAVAPALSPEDEELLASLAGKANAIKMLNQRLNIIREYLGSLPPSSLTDASLPGPPPKETNHALLRSISSMLSRIPLLTPPSAGNTETGSSDANTASTARAREKEDVHMTVLLAALTRSVADAQALASKYQIVQREKTNRERPPYGRPPGSRQPFGDDEGGRGLAERIGGY